MAFKKGSQRIFNNKVYFLFDWCSTKREATRQASQLRKGKDKWFVRVVPAGSGYHIWRR